MRYRGYLGEVTVAGDLLLLTTHAHGPQRQWQLALEDIGQVRLSMPEGERPGSLQVLPLAPADVAGDEYAVQFEAGDADTFTALAAWLEEIVQLNLGDGDGGVPAEVEDEDAVAGAAAADEEDDGTLVFWGVSDLPPAPEPIQAPPYAMRLLVAGSITAVLLVAVVVLTWPGGGKKAADHHTAQPTRSATSTLATPSDSFSITPPVPPSVSPLHQTWSPYPRRTGRSPRPPGGPVPPNSPAPKPPGEKRVVLGTQCAQHYAYATDTAGDQVQCLPEPGMHPGGKLVWRWQLPGIIPNG
ncbi:MAG: hypothetical protein ACJ73S_12245 [Mycobacteriales bacterium]